MANNSKLPLWATPERKTHLIALFNRSGGFCVFGHKNCLIPEHHYEVFIEDLIADWKADDREQRLADWIAEQRRIHSLGEKTYPLRGQFSAISQSIYGDSQPLYFIQGIGVSGLTLKPFAKVRISSSYMRLYVDLGDTLKQVSKSRRRKAVRYGKPLPQHVANNVSTLVGKAVRDYIAH